MSSLLFSFLLHYASVLQNFEVKADDLEPIAELGRGAYGVVEKMRHVPSGQIMAVKVALTFPACCFSSLWCFCLSVPGARQLSSWERKNLQWGETEEIICGEQTALQMWGKYRILLCIMHTCVFGPNFQEKKSFILWYIDMELVLPMYNVHPYFYLKNLGQKCELYMAKYRHFLNVI